MLTQQKEEFSCCVRVALGSPLRGELKVQFEDTLEGRFGVVLGVMTVRNHVGGRIGCCVGIY